MTIITLFGLAAAPWLVEGLAILLKGTLLLAAAGLLIAVLRGASAAHRHLLLSLVLTGLLAMPLLSLAVPRWSVPVPGVEAVLPSAPTAQAPAPLSAPSDRMESSGAAADGFVTPPAERLAVPSAAQGTPAAADPSLSWLSWLLIAWGAGSALFLTWMLAGQWSVRRLVRRAEPITDPAWTESLAELRERLGLHAPVRLLRTDRSSMPMACGIVRPTVLLPAEADGWSAGHRRAVLLHELAHVKRRDCLTQSIAQLACALYWFHPGVWWAARRLRVERERACDDAVLAAGTRPSEYAGGLLELARRFRPAPGIAAATVSMARPSQLEGRVLAVLDGTRDRREPSRRTSLVAGALAMMAVVPLAAMAPGSASAEAGQTALSPDFVDLAEVAPATIPVTEGDEDLRWRGRLGEGQTLAIHTVNGPIRAVRSDSEVAEVVGERRERRRNQQEVRMETVQHPGGVTLCILAVDDGARCTADGIRGDDDRQGDRGPRTVELVVAMPNGVTLRAETMNGALDLQQVRGDVYASTMNGAIRASAARVVHARTMNGAIDVTMGRTDWTGDLTLSTMNGAVNVRLPADASTEISARTMSGRITSDFPLDIDRRPGRTTASGTLGEGGRRLTLSTMNGAIRIERAGREASVREGAREWVADSAGEPDGMEDIEGWAAFGEAMGELGTDISRIVTQSVAEALAEVRFEVRSAREPPSLPPPPEDR